LDLRIKRPPVPVDFDSLHTIQSLAHAVAKCPEIAGAQDKVVALDTNVDAPTWARIKSGEAGVKGDFLERLMDAYGNDLPLFWLALRRGYDPRSLRRLETEVERELRAERERRIAAEDELATIKKFVKETRAA
jgi:plasmid maintenance system antidote protein VapI